MFQPVCLATESAVELRLDRRGLGQTTQGWEGGGAQSLMAVAAGNCRLRHHCFRTVSQCLNASSAGRCATAESVHVDAGYKNGHCMLDAQCWRAQRLHLALVRPTPVCSGHMTEPTGAAARLQSDLRPKVFPLVAHFLPSASMNVALPDGLVHLAN